MTLQQLGWNSRLQNEYIPFQNTGLIPARIKRVERGLFTVITGKEELTAVLSGSLRHATQDEADYAVIGDWVLVYQDTSGTGMIEHILPRATFLSRIEPGNTSRIQPIAANIDTMFILLPMAVNFNPRRIERFAILSQSAGVTPVILLTKSDTADDPSRFIDSAITAAPGCDVFGISSKTGYGLDALSPFLKEGETIALMGPSGSGKSSLINALMKNETAREGAVREDDGRGRHTTTSRDFFILPSGALIMDNPGIRELALNADDIAVSGGFSEIEYLSEKCRFKDCRHESEPGCAVLDAIESGELDPGRLDAFRKLLKEARYIESKTDARIRDEEKRKWKQINKAVKEINKNR